MEKDSPSGCVLEVHTARPGELDKGKAWRANWRPSSCSQPTSSLSLHPSSLSSPHSICLPEPGCTADCQVAGTGKGGSLSSCRGVRVTGTGGKTQKTLKEMVTVSCKVTTTPVCR